MKISPKEAFLELRSFRSGLNNGKFELDVDLKRLKKVKVEAKISDLLPNLRVKILYD